MNEAGHWVFVWSTVLLDVGFGLGPILGNLWETEREFERSDGATTYKYPTGIPFVTLIGGEP